MANDRTQSSEPETPSFASEVLASWVKEVIKVPAAEQPAEGTSDDE